MFQWPYCAGIHVIARLAVSPVENTPRLLAAPQGPMQALPGPEPEFPFQNDDGPTVTHVGADRVTGMPM